MPVTDAAIRCLSRDIPATIWASDALSLSLPEPTFASAVVGVRPHPLSDDGANGARPGGDRHPAGLAHVRRPPGRGILEDGSRRGGIGEWRVDDDTPLLTTAEALQAWRAAEQVAAVSERGRVASDAAVVAARTASEAAAATAASAKAALEAATSAEATARATAEAAEVVIQAARQEADDAGADALQAGADVATAHQAYRDAVARASKRRDGGA